MATPLHYHSVSALSALLESGETSAREILEGCFARTDSLDEGLCAYLHRDDDDARAQADAADARRREGKVRGPLDGIPVSVKDLIAVRGQPLTCASRILENYVSPYDADVVERLKEAGCVLWGRLNMDEFAMGSSNENSAFGRACNPWNRERVSGGSSGGSAVAVAAGEIPLSLGSDTGGSIRQPAAFCGIVGMKPTYGRVSRYGLAAFASSLDQIGPLARNVDDAASLLGAIAGHDRRDSTSLREAVPDFREQSRSLAERPWRIGVPREYFSSGIDGEVASSIRAVIDRLAGDGCEVVDISLPHTELAVPVYYVIATAEASSNLARYDGIRYTRRAADAGDAIEVYHRSRGEGFGAEVKRRILLGSYVLSSGYYDAYYLRAQKVRTLIRQDFLDAFETVDAVVAPTSPTVAFRAGERTNDPLSMYLSDIFTLNVNLAGLPALSLPVGVSEDGLPIGFQVIGAPLQESAVLGLARRVEALAPAIGHPFA